MSVLSELRSYLSRLAEWRRTITTGGTMSACVIRNSTSAQACVLLTLWMAFSTGISSNLGMTMTGTPTVHG